MPELIRFLRKSPNELSLALCGPWAAQARCSVERRCRCINKHKKTTQKAGTLRFLAMKLQNDLGSQQFLRILLQTILANFFDNFTSLTRNFSNFSQKNSASNTYLFKVSRNFPTFFQNSETASRKGSKDTKTFWGSQSQKSRRMTLSSYFWIYFRILRGHKPRVPPVPTHLQVCTQNKSKRQCPNTPNLGAPKWLKGIQVSDIYPGRHRFANGTFILKIFIFMNNVFIHV